MFGILIYLSWFLPAHFQEPALEGHWLKISGPESSCTEELIFQNNEKFKILNECFDEQEIYEVASGRYVLDGPVIYFGGLNFSSRVSDYYTREYTRIEWKIRNDTLQLTVYRFEPEERTFVRY